MFYREKERRIMESMGIEPEKDWDEEDKKIAKRLKKEEDEAILKNKIADTKRNEKNCTQYIKRRMREEHSVNNLSFNIATVNKKYNVRQIEYDLAEGSTPKAKLLFLKKYYEEREAQHSLDFYKSLNAH